jgi:hypothetical protein
MQDNPNNFQFVARPRLPMVGEEVFASGWLATIGLLNLFYAISVLAGSTIFITTASWLVGDARPWGWLMLAVGLIQLMAAPGVLMGRVSALGIAMLSVLGHVVAAVMFISDEPWIAVGLLLLDAAVLICVLVVLRSARPATA